MTSTAKLVRANRVSSTAITLGNWHHLAMSVDRSTGQLRAWLNGVEQTNSSLGNFIVPANDSIDSVRGELRMFSGYQEGGASADMTLDDVRIYSRALTDSDVAGLYAANDDPPAGAPDPANYASIEVSPSCTLSWMPGKPATYTFDVYFGTDPDAVAAADPNTPNIYKGNQSVTTYSATSLQADQEYFWRIDEVRDGTVIPGPLWRFSTNAVSGEYRLDFGTAVSAVKPGYIGVLYDEETWVNGSPFTLTASEVATWVTTRADGGNGDLLYDYVKATGAGAKLILTFSGVPAGDYTLKFHQWLKNAYDVPVRAWLQEQGGTLLLELGTTKKNTLPYTADVSLLSGKTYEFVVREANNQNYAYIAGFELVQKNRPPSFINDPILGETVAESIGYLTNLVDNVVDPDLEETLTFTKVSGPVWVSVEADGTLSGTPAEANIGSNVVQVQVTDSENSSDTADVTIEVVNMYLGDKGVRDFAGLASKWLGDCEGYDYCDGADLSNDGIVDLDDLLIFCQNWMN